MVGRAFSVKVDLDLHAITCPGVWLCPNGKIALQIHIFDSCVTTQRLTPIFPLLYHNKFTFKKIFTGVTTLAELEKKLAEECILAELIQWSPTTNKNICLAVFETNLVDLLYPVPCYKGLLAGVDVDLLMEPTKFFPGILAPKIEISTKTTIEEVTNFDVRPVEARVINPKVINSVFESIIYRINNVFIKKEKNNLKKESLDKKESVTLDKKKQNTYICRLCRRKKSNGEAIHDGNLSDQCTLASKNQCYLSSSQKKQTCNCSMINSQKSCENYNICTDAHILDSCPICLKYKCYFSNKKSDSNNLSKLYDSTNYQSSQKNYSESRPKLFSGGNGNTVHESCKSNVSKLSNAIHSLNLQNDTKNCCYKTCNDDICNRDSLLERHRSHSICRSNSVPTLKDDPTTSILLAKMRQLERTKERLNYANCLNRDSDQTYSCDDFQKNEARKGFYKHLGKFYKRMYKQAKHRVYELDDK